MITAPRHREGTSTRTIVKTIVTSAGQGHAYHCLWWRYRVRNLHPWDEWNRDHQAVFIHVPKNAGTSIYSTFGMQQPDHTHCPAYGYQVSNRQSYKQAYSFAFVRDPLSRAMSAFNYLKYQPIGNDDASWAEAHLGEFRCFNAFVRALENPLIAAKVMSWRHFMPQWYFLTDLRGRNLLSFIGKVETLDADVEQVGLRLGICPDLQRRNVSSPPPLPEGSPEARTTRIIARLYREDYRRYGYAPLSRLHDSTH